MALLIKRGPVKLEQLRLWDWQAYHKRTWLTHLEATQYVVLEKSILHGIGCLRTCCSAKTFVVEVRKR